MTVIFNNQDIIWVRQHGIVGNPIIISEIAPSILRCENMTLKVFLDWEVRCIDGGLTKVIKCASYH